MELVTCWISSPERAIGKSWTIHYQSRSVEIAKGGEGKKDECIPFIVIWFLFYRILVAQILTKVIASATKFLNDPITLWSISWPLLIIDVHNDFQPRCLL